VSPTGTFRYLGRTFDPESATARFRYSLDAEGTRHEFEERFEFAAAGAVGMAPERLDALDRVLRHLFLAAGVSYFKAAAPPVVVVESEPLSEPDVAFYATLYELGLAEFAYRNGFNGWCAPRFEVEVGTHVPAAVPNLTLPGGPLVPFGGGKDSVVTLDALRAVGREPLPFVVNEVPAITTALSATGLRARTVRRTLDKRLFELNAAGAFNGHVPITAIVSLAALADSLLVGSDAVVMSNERSASAPNFVWNGLSVNHQYSKSFAFERDLRALVARAISPDIEYFSLLRPFSELRVVRHFATLPAFHHVVTSCNRAFSLEPARRRSGWCRDCPKCRFVFLALACFLPRAEVVRVFGGDLLADRAQAEGFLALLGVDGPKPLECVGEIEESRAAAQLLFADAGWRDAAVLRVLDERLPPGARVPDDEVERLLATGTEHFVPARYEDAVDAVR
jgi:hypothetical protein